MAYVSYGPVKLSSKGSFKRSTNFLKRMLKLDIHQILENYGKIGVAALAQYTPKDTGTTAASWYYKVETHFGGASISWFNSNTNEGVPIALLIQYGHGTGWGGYVRPVDYINPALGPIFDDIADRVWKEVENA